MVSAALGEHYMKTGKLADVIRALALALGLLAAGGCGTSRAARFFELPAPLQLASGQNLNLADAKQRVGLLPIKLAAYLNGPQIVTRLGDEEIRVDEFNRWGIPLADSIASTLALQMLQDLPGTYIDVFPWSGGTAFDYQVRVEIGRFDGALGKSASLTAQWTITRGRNADAVVARNISHYSQPVEGDTYEALTRAMSKLVVMLARDISAAIRGL